MKDLKDLHHVHILGICGTLMAPFACLLKRRGIQVTGTDENVYPPMSDLLKNNGIPVFQGYKAENLEKMAPDLVIVGNVIRSTNPEVMAAIQSKMPYLSLPEMMEKYFLPNTRNLVVAGTHGKTTTSSLLAHTLAFANQKPSYFIGGVSLNLPESFHIEPPESGRENYFVLEGDEYDTAFWDKVPKFNHYLPDEVILTSIEYDHADIYPDLPSVVRAFEGLMQRVRPGGRVIACHNYSEVQNVIKKAASEKPGGFKTVFYGLQGGDSVQWSIGDIHLRDGLTFFSVFEYGKKTQELSLQIHGQYNVLNALAVWIQCKELGIPAETVSKALSTFQGVKRRQEVRGTFGGVTVIDDFAHHPTAVRETLMGLRKRFPGRRLIAVFEPRSATSRRKIFQKDYEQAFDAADTVFIAQPYDQSRISNDERFSSEQLIEGLKQKGKQAFLITEIDAGVSAVAELARDHKESVVAVLSNGGFGGFIGKLIKNLVF